MKTVSTPIPISDLRSKKRALVKKLAHLEGELESKDRNSREQRSIERQIIILKEDINHLEREIKSQRQILLDKSNPRDIPRTPINTKSVENVVESQQDKDLQDIPEENIESNLAQNEPKQSETNQSDNNRPISNVPISTGTIPKVIRPTSLEMPKRDNIFDIESGGDLATNASLFATPQLPKANDSLTLPLYKTLRQYNPDIPSTGLFGKNFKDLVQEYGNPQNTPQTENQKDNSHMTITDYSDEEQQPTNEKLNSQIKEQNLYTNSRHFLDKLRPISLKNQHIPK